MDPAELDNMLSGLPSHHDANLLLGFSHADDAAVYRLPSGETIVQTVDFFTPIVDDPYEYGAIAAANSLSDVYAMNGRPLFALNICCFPKQYPAEVWREVLRGGAEKTIEAGIPIAGGHTVDDTEPKYGLVVTGIVNEKSYWQNAGAQPGDVMILTKTIGTGVLTTALKNGDIERKDINDVVTAMKTLNRAPQLVLSEIEVHACTDITGNGLMGHASEVARASEVQLEFSIGQVPFYAAAIPLAAANKFPGGTRANRRYLGDYVTAAENLPAELVWLMFDAQTSGGLLAFLPASQAESALHKLHDSGVHQAAIVGRVSSGSGIRIIA
jgi:selenide, water dikinase